MTDCYYQFREKSDIYRGIIQTINWPLLRPLFIDTPVKIGKKWGEGVFSRNNFIVFQEWSVGGCATFPAPTVVFYISLPFPFCSLHPPHPSLPPFFFYPLFISIIRALSPPPLFFYYFFSPATFDSEISLLILTAGVFIFELSETGETVTVRNRVSKSRLIFRSICQLGGYLPSLLLEVRTNLEGEKEGEI